MLADIEKAKKQLEEKLISFEKKHDRTIDDFKKNNSKIEKRADEHDKKNADLETILETVLARLTSLESQHADLETRYKTLLSEHKALQKAYLELKTTVNFSSRKQEKLESCSDTTQQAVVLETDKKKVVVEQTYKMFTDQLLEVMKQSSTKNDETIHEIFPSFISIISDLSEIMNLDDVRKLQYITLDEIKNKSKSHKLLIKNHCKT